MNRIIDTGNGFIDSIGFFAIQPGATFVPAQLSDGDSLTIRRFDPPSKAYIFDVGGQWQSNLGGESFRIHSPQRHDNIDGINIGRTTSGAFEFIIPFGFREEVYQGEQLIVEMTGSALAGQIDWGFIQLFYEKLPKLKSNLIGYDEYAFRSRKLFMKANFAGYTVGGASGGWLNEVPISSLLQNQVIKRDREYAFLSILQNSSTSQVFRVKGRDFSTPVLYKGIPTVNRGDEYVYRSYSFGVPMIPIFSGENFETLTVSAMSLQGINQVRPVFVFTELCSWEEWEEEKLRRSKNE